MFFVVILIGITLVYGFFKWTTINQNYFAIRKIKAMKSAFMFGNTGGIYRQQYRPNDNLEKIYYSYPNEKLIGMFDMREPVYLVRDLDLIKQITITDFRFFEDRVSFIDSSSDTWFGNSVALLRGNKWRDMRAILVPALTGKKMKIMFESATQCADNAANYLLNESNRDKPIRLEVKKFFFNYSSDATAACAFGLKVDSMSDPANGFWTLLENHFNFGDMKVFVKLQLFRLFPKIMRAMGFEFFTTQSKAFFKTMLLDAMKIREGKGIIRPDVIHNLMFVRKDDFKVTDEQRQSLGGADIECVKEKRHIERAQIKRSKLTDDEIIAQCFLLFVAGSDTLSNLVSFMVYEIAIHNEIQQKMFEEISEISEISENLNGAQLSYDTLSKLKYTDQVISEALRKWPAVTVIKRSCSKDYVCKLNGREEFLIEKGKSILIPIDVIHHDPKYFPEPETFDPDRFSDENKHRIPSGAFIPFGIGPRSCLGSRLALMNIKTLLFHMLLHFNIQPCEKTQIPIQVKTSIVGWMPEKGIHLEFVPRSV